MPQRTIVIGSRSGLHARPAAVFVRAAARHPVSITIGREGQPPVNAASLLSVLALGARYGDTVTLSADGAGADDAIGELATLLERDLDDTASAPTKE